jgi:hypothetical protein
MSEPTPAVPPNPNKRRRRIVRVLAIVAILVVVLIVTGPWLAAHTGLRDQAINAALASPSVTASSDSASFGWFSSPTIRGLNLKSSNDRLDVRVEEITAEQSILGLLASAPDLGAVKVEKVRVQLELPLNVQPRGAGNRLEPTFTATVKDAGLTVRLTGEDEPVIDIDGMDLTFRVEQAEEGRVLTLDPLVIFDRRKLSPKLTSRMLHVFDPTMTDTPQIAGEISLAIDKLRVPLGVPRDKAVKGMELEGKFVLHDVSGEVKNPLRLALVRLVADMNGKEAPKVVHLAKDAEIRFQVRDGRLHHEGLSIGLPDIDPELKLTSRGSVGLDRTLDLFVELPRLDPALRKEKGPAKCRITGTIANPQIRVEDASLVLRQPNRKEPLFAADGMNLNMRVETTAAGPMLVVEPVEVFKKRKLNLGVAPGLVKFLAPDVQTERQVDGEISLSLSKLRMPLGVPQDEALKHMEVEGALTLHRVSSEVKGPMWQVMIRLLADLNGKKSPDSIQLAAQESEIRFQVREGRLHHEGMRIGFPDIDPELQITSRGSIGLDETLDLFVELPRLDPAQRKEKGPAKCHITGTIANPRIQVEDASLVLRQPNRKEPLFAADGMNLNMRVETSAAGPVLVVEPVEVFKKRKLNLGVAPGLVKFLAPDVQTERQVDGEISLTLSKLRMPLGVPQDEALKHMEVEGALTLHRVSSEVKGPMWQAVIRLLADLNGKTSPDSIQLAAQESEIRFQVREGRLHHEGMRIGFPGIDPEWVVRSSGSIGLDESLDLRLELPRLRKNKREQGPLSCQVTGTISDPKITIPDGSLVVHLTDDDAPALTADHVNLVFRVETSGDTRLLSLAPVKVFDKLKLTPEASDQLLALIAPTLADLSGVQGTISLTFDTFRVPLGVPKKEFVKRVELSGKLQLHEITAAVKTPLLQATVKVLADMYGKNPSEVVRVVENAEVRFQVKDGRIHHENMRFGLPDISPDLLIHSSGSVGYDKTFDLVLDVPSILFDKSKLEVRKKSAPVRLRVTGTFDKPIVTEIKEGKGN